MAEPQKTEEVAAEAGQGEKTLSQHEIDSLLGFASGSDEPKTGIKVLLDRALLSYERLPMLEIVFDRFIRTISTSLRNLTSENVDVSIDSITSMRFEDYLNAVPLPTLLTIFHAIEWENLGLITIDSALTYAMVDVLLGGGRSNRPVKIEGRPFSTIEQDIVKSMASLMLDDMSTAFNPLTPVTFQLERLETNPRFAAIVRPSSAVILIALKVDIDGRGGKAEVLFPYATLEPVKELLVQLFSAESFGGDTSWEEYLSKEVRNTVVHLQAQLPEKNVTLKEVAQLKVGSTILFDAGPQDEVPMLCRGIKMLSGRLGSAGHHVAVQITQIYNKAIQEELL